jgi:DNA-binding NtrC family response regulator
MNRILMIGGDHDVVEAGRMVLMGAGYTVAMARDVRDAIALRDHFRPDLLYIDVVARRASDAVAMAKRLHEAGFHAPMLILATVERHVEFYRYCSDGTMAPAPDFPEKPMEPAALVKNVRHALEQRDD